MSKFELKKKEAKNKTGFYINIDKSLHKKLKTFALQNDTTMGEVIEQLIDQVLNV